MHGPNHGCAGEVEKNIEQEDRGADVVGGLVEDLQDRHTGRRVEDCAEIDNAETDRDGSDEHGDETDNYCTDHDEGEIAPSV